MSLRYNGHQEALCENTPVYHCLLVLIACTHFFVSIDPLVDLDMNRDRDRDMDDRVDMDDKDDKEGREGRDDGVNRDDHRYLT